VGGSKLLRGLGKEADLAKHGYRKVLKEILFVGIDIEFILEVKISD
jgi:hypothetical protein